MEIKNHCYYFYATPSVAQKAWYLISHYVTYPSKHNSYSAVHKNVLTMNTDPYFNIQM